MEATHKVQNPTPGASGLNYGWKKRIENIWQEMAAEKEK